MSKNITIAFEDMTDEEIVLLAQNDNVQAVEYIIANYKNFVKSRARTYFLIGADKEDLIQEGMIGLFKAIRDFRPDRIASFKGFADLCVTRQIITAIKTATRQKHIPLNSYVSLNKPVYDEESERTLLDTLTEEGYFDPEEIMITKEHFVTIEEKLSTVLSQLERNVMKLYVEGKSYTEIAKRMKKSEKSIDNALQRIKRKIEKHLLDPTDA